MTRVTIAEAEEWKRLYEQEGLSIEAIALNEGRSYSSVQRWLVKLAYTPRPANAPRTSYHRDTPPKSKSSGDPIRQAVTPRRVTGHRRRGRY